jgi:hypothetical protein
VRWIVARTMACAPDSVSRRAYWAWPSQNSYRRSGCCGDTISGSTCRFVLTKEKVERATKASRSERHAYSCQKRIVPVRVRPSGSPGTKEKGKPRSVVRFSRARNETPSVVRSRNVSPNDCVMPASALSRTLRMSSTCKASWITEVRPRS